MGTTNFNIQSNENGHVEVTLVAEAEATSNRSDDGEGLPIGLSNTTGSALQVAAGPPEVVREYFLAIPYLEA
ncbi:hypothetical protein PQX77_003735 [Marasmius sp. AFHP31]|nr:hypothetical protein PQX77_003735 [Marasmius sp. AFHP31]